VRFFFADESRQTKPSRSDMGALVAIGGVALASDAVRSVEHKINDLCRNAGFPSGEEFKWSPGHELWMRENLIGDERRQFFINIFRILKEYEGLLTVVIEDTACKCATDALTSEIDVTRLYLERTHSQLNRQECDGIVIVDRPVGSRADEDKFLLNCLETIQEGTEYLNPEKFAINVVSSPSKFIRLLQVADVVVGCTLSTVAGQKKYAPEIFETFRNLFDNDSRRIGGIGLKIHPDLKYINLYYWVVGDEYYVRGSKVKQLPIRGYKFFKNDGAKPVKA